ncbi:MAG TPA: DNA-binding protein [Candidatus Omnitrophota bacterium]|nr:DNA-binding protein [Candidatus Omnitrophota bacterium]
MKKILLTVFFLLAISGTCFAQVFSSSDLILDAKDLDGKIIRYQGELIGSILKRGENVWLNLYDGSNAIGVFTSIELAREVKLAGSDKMRGDVVEVEGTFQRSCLEHGGVLDIHAQKLNIIKKGFVLKERIHHKKIIAIAILLGVLACLLIIHILLKKRNER